jgi:hypothetical protein
MISKPNTYVEYITTWFLAAIGIKRHSGSFAIVSGTYQIASTFVVKSTVTSIDFAGFFSCAFIQDISYI